jgi:hypothetical protein
MNRSLSIHTPHGPLHGELFVPDAAQAIVMVARSHPAAVDSLIAANLAARGYAILSIELLTQQESHFPDATLDVARLTLRLLDMMDLLRKDVRFAEWPLGIFATGDVTPAAVRAAAQRDQQIKALACHGGLVDRAGLQALSLLSAPLLMLQEQSDSVGQTAFQRAVRHLHGIHEAHPLGPGEDPILRVAAWFGLHLHP